MSTDLTADAPARPTEADDRLEDVKARLEARGMLRTATQPVALPEIISSPAIVLHDAGDGTASAMSATSSATAVAGAPMADVRCPGCTAIRPVGVNRTGFECRSCRDGWRWAICSHCDRMVVTHEGQDTWRCRVCDGLTRAWWRTTRPTDEPSRIIRRRAQQFAELRVEADIAVRRETTRRAAWRSTAIAAVGAIAAAALLVIANSTFNGAGSGAACGAFHRISGQIQSGALTGAAAERELKALVEQSSDPKMQAAAIEMATAPSTASVQVAAAQTRFVDACNSR